MSEQIEVLMTALAPQIAKAVPGHVTGVRMAQVIESVLERNPKLVHLRRVKECIMQAAQLGLEPGVLDHCYLIPRGAECTLMLGYEGMVELMWRSGLVVSIYTECVYEGEKFEVHGGSDAKIVHVPDPKKRVRCKKGEWDNVIAAYAVVKMQSGGTAHSVLYRGDIDHRRAKGAGGSKAWLGDFPAMAKKSALREVWKWVPKTAEVRGMDLEIMEEPIQVENCTVDIPDDATPALVEETKSKTNTHTLIDLCTEAGISVASFKQHLKDRTNAHGRRCTEARNAGKPQPPAPAKLSPAQVAAKLEQQTRDTKAAENWEKAVLGLTPEGVFTEYLDKSIAGQKLQDMDIDHLRTVAQMLQGRRDLGTLTKLVHARGVELKAAVA